MIEKIYGDFHLSYNDIVRQNNSRRLKETPIFIPYSSGDNYDFKETVFQKLKFSTQVKFYSGG